MTVTVPRQRKKTKVLRIPKTGFGIECLIFFIILFEYHFFYLFDYEVGIIALILKLGDQMIIGGLSCLVALCAWLFYRRRIRQYSKYLRKYCAAVFFIFLLFVLYTTIIYPNQKIADTFRIGGRFLHPILAIGFIFIFDRDKGPERWLSILNKISFCWYLYIIVQSIAFNLSGRLLFDMASYFSGGSGTGFIGNVRISLGAFGNIMLLYNIVYVMNKSNRSIPWFAIIQIILGAYCVVFIQQVRAYIVVLFVCVTVIILLASKTKFQQVIKPLLILGIVIFLCTSSLVQDFIYSFSTESELGTSTEARLYAWEYFFNAFLKNPLFGFAWPGDEAYFSIAHGPLGTAWANDVGVVGLMAQLGLFAIPFYVVPLIRMVYILHKIGWKRAARENMFLVVLLVYLIGTSITLLITDSGRSIAFPFVIALYEYYYKQYKKAQCSKQLMHEVKQ